MTQGANSRGKPSSTRGTQVPLGCALPHEMVRHEDTTPTRGHPHQRRGVQRLPCAEQPPAGPPKMCQPSRFMVVPLLNTQLPADPTEQRHGHASMRKSLSNHRRRKLKCYFKTIAKTQLPQAITEIPKYTKTTQAMTSKHRASSLTAPFPLPGVAADTR